MRILTMQSSNLDLTKDITYADPKLCNFSDNKVVYELLFKDYNNKHNTSYEGFFWGFSELLEDNLEDEISRAKEMCGHYNNNIILILEVPDELVLETDFYNFVDEICAITGIDTSIESIWESIYDLRPNREKQVIFPYIKKEWIIKCIK